MDCHNFTLCPEERERLFFSRTGLDDSVLSSVCGISTAQDSLKKIQELKLLNEQTEQEQKKLVLKKNSLEDKLRRLEEQLNTLIETYVHQPIQQNTTESQSPKAYKINKPGSILSRFHNQNSCISFASQNSSKTNIESQEYENSIKKQIYNKEIETRKQNLIRHSRTTDNSPFISPRTTTSPHQYRKSLGNQNYIKMLWETENHKKKLSETNIQPNLKSYLSPGRAAHQSYLPMSSGMARFRKQKRV